MKIVARNQNVFLTVVVPTTVDINVSVYVDVRVLVDIRVAVYVRVLVDVGVPVGIGVVGGVPVGGSIPCGTRLIDTAVRSRTDRSVVSIATTAASAPLGDGWNCQKQRERER